MIALPSIATNPSSGAIDCSDFRTDFRSAPNICASYLATALIDLAVIGLVLNAAAGSFTWYGRFGKEMHLAPYPFAYSDMTRSGRMTHERLREAAPRFVAEYEKAVAD